MSKPVTVTIDLSEVETYALIDELEDRGYTVDDESENVGKWDIYALYELRRFNDAAFDKAFGDYVYEQIGRVL